MDGITLTNSSRQAMRIMLVLGCVLLVLAAIALTLQRADPRFATTANTSASAVCLLGLALCGPGAVAMFLSALITLRPVRVTDRVFDRFRRGEMLADWRFTEAEWDDFVGAESVRLRKGSALVWLWLVVPFAVVAVIVLWTIYPSGLRRTASLAMVAVVAVLALWSMRVIQKAFRRKRIATLRLNPRVLIGSSSIYCGGFFRPWNVSMLVLQRARLLPGPPMMLEVTIGASQVLQAAGTMVAVASWAAGGAAGAASGNMQSQILVPVPAGRHDEAARVMQQLVCPPPTMILPTRRVIAPARLPGQRWSSRRWWAISATMFAAGLGLFLLGASSHDPLDAVLSSMGRVASVAGLFLWIGSLITAMVALAASIRSWRSRARSPADVS